MASSIFVGNVEVLPLLDAVLSCPVAEAVPGVEAAFLRHHYPGLVTADGHLGLSVTCYLLRSRGLTILVDTGIGPRRRGTWPVGRLHVALAGVGILPAAIDVVVNTHFHADHVGWNTIDDRDGLAVPWFTNAQYLVEELEWAYWSRPVELERPDNAHLRECVLPLMAGAEVRIVTGTAAITSEVALEPLPGHTPGHVGVTITSGDQGAIIIGDASHHLAQLDHPDWSPVWDEDRRRAADTRARMFERAERSRLLVAGGHWPYPGTGRLVRVARRRVYEAVPLTS